MDSLSIEPTQKAQLHEVADGLLEIYLTLARMRYLDYDWIERGPHDISRHIARYRSHGLDDAVIYLYSILPYVGNGGSGEADFYDGGEFADFRNENEVEQGRDPLYLEEEREMLKPWMTPLSMMGNHQTSLIYSARDHCIWMRCQSFTGSVDPALQHFEEDELNSSNEAGDVSPDEDGAPASAALAEGTHEDGEGSVSEPATIEDDGSQGDDDISDEEEEEDDHDEQDEDDYDISDEEEEEDDYDDDYAYDGIESRPAAEVLRDINQWYKELKAIPGGGEHSSSIWDKTITQPLYVKHGWPEETFDGDAFLIDLIRHDAALHAEKTAKEPFKDLQTLQNNVERYHSHSYWEPFTERIRDAKTIDEEWEWRFRLWERRVLCKRAEKRLENTARRVERLCANGAGFNAEHLPLWQQEQLRANLRQTQKSLAKIEEEFNNMPALARDRDRGLYVRLKRAKAKVSLHERAFETAKTEAELKCPGQTFVLATGRAPLDQIINRADAVEDLLTENESHKEEIGLAREWASRIPQDAPTAKQAAGWFIEGLEKSLANFDADYNRLTRK